jgi:hypothetical protein
MVFEKFGQRILVREYDVEYCKRIKILENKDIECSNGNDQDPFIISSIDGFLREYEWKSGKYSPFESGRFFPEPWEPREILDDTVVQNAFLCSEAAYINEESTLQTFINDSGRFANFETVMFEKEQTILALSKDKKTLYIGFKGTDAFGDWFVNLDIQLVESNAMTSLGGDGSVKVHQGFQKRANLLISHLLEKVKKKYQKVEKVITNGHSLGAATAAMVHLGFTSNQVHDRTIGQEFLNITFALPMFGNLALKKFIATKTDFIAFTNMHHFVNAADVIPAACLIQDFQTHAKKMGLGRIYGEIISAAQNHQDQFVRNIGHELNERNKAPQPLVAKNVPEVCIPIGKYLIFHKGKLYNYPDDHQWIAQTLLTSLWTEPYQIKDEHSIEKYGNQLATCYTSLRTFNEWKTKTDITIAATATREERATVGE